MIPLKTLEEFYTYDPETGHFHWKKDPSPRHRRMGKRADRLSDKLGRRELHVRQSRMFAHRAAWLMTNGVSASELVDHINGDPSDNRIDNLREATYSQNGQNRKGSMSNSSTGYLGVSKHIDKWTNADGLERSRVVYKARIQTRGKRIHLGTFDAPEEAHDAYLKAKRELHEFSTL